MDTLTSVGVTLKGLITWVHALFSFFFPSLVISGAQQKNNHSSLLTMAGTSTLTKWKKIFFFLLFLSVVCCWKLKFSTTDSSQVPRGDDFWNMNFVHCRDHLYSSVNLTNIVEKYRQRWPCTHHCCDHVHGKMVFYFIYPNMNPLCKIMCHYSLETTISGDWQDVKEQFAREFF